MKTRKAQTIHLSQIQWKKRNIPTTFNLEIDRNFLLGSDYGTINKHITKQLNALFDDKCVNFVAETIL